MERKRRGPGPGAASRCPARRARFNLSVTIGADRGGSTWRRGPPVWAPMGNARERMTKKVYATRAAILREKLVQLQVELKPAPFKVLLIVAGPEGAGRGDLLNALAEWLDPRGVETFSY